MTSVRQLIVFSVLLFILKSHCLPSYERKIKFHLKSIKCSHDAKMFNGTINCSIKPFRNRTQLATALYTFNKACDDLWANVVVYFKFGGTAAYRQWLFNIDENICAIFKGDIYPPLLTRLLYNAVEDVAPNVVHKCPYVGEEGIKNVNADHILSGLVPQVLPTGDYRFLFRFHTTSNKTFFEVLFGGRVDAVNPLEAIAMG